MDSKVKRNQFVLQALTIYKLVEHTYLYARTYSKEELLIGLTVADDILGRIQISGETGVSDAVFDQRNQIEKLRQMIIRVGNFDSL